MSAIDELKPYLRRELGWPLNELGRIRFRKSDLDGAEKAFLEADALGWDAEPGLSLVHLSRSRPDLASATIRSALENPPMVPSKELPPATELRRAPLLEAQVVIECEAGDLERAKVAVKELTQIAAKFGSKALAASSAYARGRLELAAGNPDIACSELECAMQLWAEVGAPYEAAMARMWLGEACRDGGQQELAAQRFQTAAIAFRQLGASREADIAARAHAVDKGNTRSSAGVDSHSSTLERAPAGIFCREGDFWSITFEGESTRIRDARGLHYLARLLSEPGREFHVLDLVHGETAHEAVPMTTARDAGLGMGLEVSGLLDEQAKQSYRRRLLEIEEEIEDAEAMNNPERAVQSRFEREFLIRELGRAVGLGGRNRKAGTTSERARVSVTRAVRSAMARIRDQHPLLGKHLERAIRTGTYCAYLPDTRLPATWQTRLAGVR